MLEVFENLPGEPLRDLALEEEMLAHGPAGSATLILCSWATPTLVLGRGQRPEEVHQAFCREHGILVTHRSSGGAGVLHRDDLSVSLVMRPDHPWTRTIPGLYEQFLSVLQAALQAIGIHTERHVGPEANRHPRSPICFETWGRETLLISGRKAVGCAQARRRRAVLVHGALLLHLDPVLHGGVFGVPPERIEASLCPLPSLDRSTLCRELVERFARALNLPVTVPRTDWT